MKLYLGGDTILYKGKFRTFDIDGILNLVGNVDNSHYNFDFMCPL